MTVMTSIMRPDQIDILLDAMLAAGRVILEVRDAGPKARQKGDGSPVTIADERAEAILLAALTRAAPDIPVIAEEAVEAGHNPQTGETFFLVDPLDGTKEFIRGGEDFTVNIGLIHQKRPVFGLIYAPASGRVFGGQAGQGAWQGKIDCRLCDTAKEVARTIMQVRRPDPQNLAAVASYSHRPPQTDDWLTAHNIKTMVSAGSSLKFCLIVQFSFL